MREIKFRLWNPSSRVVTGGLDLNTLLMTTDRDFVNEFSENKMVWMQYTGLKDKNGKEIYDGDILKGHREKDEFLSERNWIGVVKYASVRCAFVLEITETHGNTYKDIVSCTDDFMVDVSTGIDYQHEIIGNIHQNPDLLTTK